MTRQDLERLLGACRPAAVPVPELGPGAVLHLRPLTVAELLDVEAAQPPADATPWQRAEWMARVVAYAVADGEGRGLLTPADRGWVQGWPAAVLSRAFRAAAAAAALTDGAVDAAEKN